MKKKYANVLTEKTIFTQKAISYEGYIAQGVPLSLLSDDDIVSYLKNELHSSEEVKELRKQYFARNKRLKPLWKSEPEFSQLEQAVMGADTRRSFKATLRAISDTVFFMNEREKRKAVEEKNIMETVAKSDKEEAKTAEFSLTSQRKIVRIFEMFESFSLEKDLDFEYALVFVTRYYESNYTKLHNSNIFIEFAPNRVMPLKAALAVTAVPPTEDEKNGFYYIYSSENNIYRMKRAGMDLGKELMRYIACNWK